MYGGIGPDKIFMQDCVCADDLYVLDMSTLQWREHSKQAWQRDMTTQSSPAAEGVEDEVKERARATTKQRFLQDTDSPQRRRRQVMLQELRLRSSGDRSFPEPRTNHSLTFIPTQQAAWLVGGLSPKVRPSVPACSVAVSPIASPELSRLLSSWQMIASLKGLRMKQSAAFADTNGRRRGNKRELAPPVPKVAYVRAV